MSTPRTPRDQARQAAADALAFHWRVNPPGGECKCGHITPLGAQYTAHLADVALDAARQYIIEDYVSRLAPATLTVRLPEEVASVLGLVRSTAAADALEKVAIDYWGQDGDPDMHSNSRRVRETLKRRATALRKGEMQP